MTFNLLCEKLGINTGKSDSDNLVLLKTWFAAQVSSDRQFTGDIGEQWSLYKEQVIIYLDQFSLPANVDDNQLAVQAAFHGFDKVLLSIKPESHYLNTLSAQGTTSLHIAAALGYYHTVEALLSLGADPSVLNKQKQYPWFSALFLPISHNELLKQIKIKIFHLLTQHETHRLNDSDESGNTILHEMASQGFASLMADRLNIDTTSVFLKNNHNHYPIHTAVLNNQLDCVKLLLPITGVSNLTDDQGCVALHFAACWGDQATLLQCCNASEQIDITDQNGRTALMLAAANSRLNLVTTLIDKGANVNLVDLEGYTVFHHAIKSGNLELVRWLVDNTPIDINALNQNFLAISESQGTREMTKFLTDLG